MKKIMFTLLIGCTFLSSISLAQLPNVHTWPGLPGVDNPGIPDNVNGYLNYTAIDEVNFLPNMNFIASSGNEMNGLLDNNIIIPIDQVYTGYPDPQDPYIIDTSLPVGAYEGSASVDRAGGSSYAMSINLPQGINGMEPSLGLSYSSNAKNGALGIGWSLAGSLSTISRSNRNYFQNGVIRTMALDNSDVYQIDGAQLILIEGSHGQNGAVYMAENQLKTRVVLHGNTESAKWFEVQHGDGRIVEYGNPLSAGNARFDTEDNNTTLLWLVNKIKDQFGNYIEFEYTLSDRSPRISSIKYTGNENTGLQPINRIDFIYSERLDEVEYFIIGNLGVQKYLLKELRIINDGVQYSKYKMDYAFDLYSQLISITKFGSNGTPLNPTKFYYGEPGQPTTTPTNFDQNTDDLTLSTADFNNDGYSDVFRFLDNGNGISAWEIMTYNGEGSFTQYASGPVLGHMIPIDYNGDGFLDLATIRISSGPNYSLPIITGCEDDPNNSYNYYGILPPCYDPMQPQAYKLRTVDVMLANGDGSYTNHNVVDLGLGEFCNPEKVVIPGDFNGNGRSELLLLYGGNSEPHIPSNIAMIHSYDIDTQMSNGQVVDNQHLQYFPTSNLMNVMDFNGNGKLDIIMVPEDNDPNVASSTIIELEHLFFNGHTYESHLVFEADPTDDFIKDNLDGIQFSDLNADGKTDVLFKNTVLNQYDIKYSDGIDFRTKHLSELDEHINNCELEIRHLGDFNGDGITDILYEYKTDLVNCVSTQYDILYGIGGFESQNSPYKKVTNLPIFLDSDFLFGDFNADGSTDWLDKDGPNYLRTLYSQSFESLLHHIDNGYGNRLSFEYIFSTDADFLKNTSSLINPNDFNKNNDPSSTHHFANPLKTVNKFIYPLTNGGTSYTKYKYIDPIVHRQGKGFLGFRYRVSYDMNSDMKTQEFYQLNNTSESFELKYANTFKFEDIGNAALDNTVSRVQNDVFFSGRTDGIKHSYDIGNPGRVFDILLEMREDHLVKRSSQITHNSYDIIYGPNGSNYGYNLENSTTYVGDYYFDLGDPDYNNAIEKIIISNNFDQSNTWWHKYLVTGMTTTSERFIPTPQVSYSRSVNFSYDIYGKVLSETNDPGTPFEVTTNYLDFDAYGRSLTKEISSTGLNDITSSTEFDESERYIIKRINDLNEETDFTYDNVFGLPSSSTDHLGNTESSSYDEYGRLIQSIDSYGKATNYNWEWVNPNPLVQPADYLSEQDIMYEVTVSALNAPYRKTQYNRFGQPRKVKTQNFDGTEIQEVSFYDDRGRAYKTSEPFFSYQSEVMFGISTFGVNDPYDRLSKTHLEDQNGGSYLLQETYTYGISNDGYVVITNTNVDGTYKTSHTDASGAVVKTIDLGGTIDHEYYSNKQPKIVKVNGLVSSVMAYDLVGNRTAFYEPNFGTVENEYDAYGRVKWELDDKDNRYEYSYDNTFGRLTNKDYFENWDVASPVLTGSYIYDYVLSGNGLNYLKKATSPDGDFSEYSYNEQGNVIQENKSIDGSIYTTNQSYDGDGRLNSLTHVGNLTLNYQYNNLGFLTQIMHGATSVWAIGTTNARGQVENYTIGNGISSNLAYNKYGYLESQITDDNITQDYEYQFDPVSGNLDWRKDWIVNRMDDCSYDGQNRLTDFTVSNATTELPINNVLSVDYLLNGNISSSTTMGTYSYDATKPHAVTEVDNSQGLISINNQTLNFNGFHSIDEITELKDVLYNERFKYGANDQRTSSKLTVDNQLERTRHYAGFVEKQIKDGDEIEIVYINSPSGLTAMYVTENGSSSMKYLHTDHLGSITAVTDDNGNIVARQNFDPWGRHRNPSDWSYYSNDPYETDVIPEWLWRGYTGHEHMAEFNLINMNGRLYDPLLGRMLSPDNVIQSIYDTQSFNGYSYAHNNPLKYIDPDGEVPLLLLFIASTIVQGAINHFSGVPGSATFNQIIYSALTFAALPALTAGGLFAQLSFAAVLGAYNAGNNPNVSLAQGIGKAIINTVSSTFLAVGTSTAIAKLGWTLSTAEIVVKNTISSMINHVVSAAINGTSAVKGLLSNFIQSSIMSTFSALTAPKPQAEAEICDPTLSCSSDPTDFYADPNNPYERGVTIYGKKKSSFWGSFLNGLQTSLDVVGLIPGFGEIADGINAGIYLARGDYVNASLSLAAMVPLAGMAATAIKLGHKSTKILKKADVVEGIYDFTAKSGKRYVGQSGNIPKRLKQHIKSGKLAEGALVNTTEVLGGKIAREVAEQLKINSLGGISRLENLRNPIGKARQHLLP